MLINQTVQLLVSNKRLKRFFVSEEIDSNAIIKFSDSKGKKI